MPVPSFDGAGIFLMDEVLVVSSSDDDIEYHGDAEDGGYGVEGHHYGWYDAEQVTCQCHDGSGEDGGGQQLYVVASAEHEAGDMGRSKTQECPDGVSSRSSVLRMVKGRWHRGSC